MNRVRCIAGTIVERRGIGKKRQQTSMVQQYSAVHVSAFYQSLRPHLAALHDLHVHEWLAP